MTAKHINIIVDCFTLSLFERTRVTDPNSIITTFHRWTCPSSSQFVCIYIMLERSQGVTKFYSTHWSFFRTWYLVMLAANEESELCSTLIPRLIRASGLCTIGCSNAVSCEKRLRVLGRPYHCVKLQASKARYHFIKLPSQRLGWWGGGCMTTSNKQSRCYA